MNGATSDCSVLGFLQGFLHWKSECALSSGRPCLASRLSICLPAYQPIYLLIDQILSIHPSIHPSNHLSTHLIIDRSISQSIHPSIHPYIQSFIDPSNHWSIHLTIYPSIHLSIHPSHLSSKEVQKSNFRQYGQNKSRQDSQKRKSEERREEQVRESQKKEDAGARKGREVAKRSILPMFCGTGGSTSRLAKAAVVEPAGQMKDQKLHAFGARSTFPSQKCQQWRPQTQTTFGSSDVEKVSAIVARSTFGSETCPKLQVLIRFGGARRSCCR